MSHNLDLSTQASVTLREAMQRLSQTAEKCLFIVGEDLSLSGSLSDGDVRRAILGGHGLDEPIEGLFTRNPVAITHDDVFPERKLDEARQTMLRLRLEVIPVVDDQRRIVRYVTWTDLIGNGEQPEPAALDVPVVIMAGGFGTRLDPFTKVLPKPLIPVHDRPIIEHIIDRFVEIGIGRFWLTVNYKSRIMKAYFQDTDPDYEVHFVDESEPMGTAGGLQLMRGTLTTPFFVTNCDIIVNTDYRAIMDFHMDHGHAITIVGSTVHYQIPYGTCVLNSSGSLDHIKEKPKYDFLVNTGMYVVNPEMIDLIPTSGVVHMTHLIERAIDEGRTVGVFPIGEDAWIDIGQWKEYQRATEKLEL